MGIEGEPLSIEADLEAFSGDLDDACDLLEMDDGAEIPLQNLPSFEALEEHSEEMNTALFEKFGVHPGSAPDKQYIERGTPGTDAEGETVVKVFKTNVEGVYLGQRIYAKGGSVWTVRAFKVNAEKD